MTAIAVAVPLRIIIPSPFVGSFPLMASLLRYSPVAEFAKPWWQPKLPALAAAFPPISLNLPGLLQEFWEGILRAVPKKKPSYSKRRSRQMAGKGLEDVTALCHCPSCGRLKRMHVLCPSCMKKILNIWRKQDIEAKAIATTK